jgi:hypothetical protein
VKDHDSSCARVCEGDLPVGLVLERRLSLSIDRRHLVSTLLTSYDTTAAETVSRVWLAGKSVLHV